MGDGVQAACVALAAAIEEILRGGDVLGAVTSASEAVADKPWDVVRAAGALARARWVVAEADLGLTASLREVGPTSERAVVTVPRGCLHPRRDTAGRRLRGAFDTPEAWAKRLASATVDAADGPVRVGGDLAAGTGALLLALREAGVPRVVGRELDPVALAVARVAVPGAELTQGDLFEADEVLDVLVANPPFVSPERQDKVRRRALTERFQWLQGRFDLAVPASAAMLERVRIGGAAGLLLPHGMLTESYGASQRRRWLQRHAVLAVTPPERFPGTRLDTSTVVMRVGAGPAPVGEHRLDPRRVVALPMAPLDHAVRTEDLDLVAGIRARSRPLGDCHRIDTGLVAHGPLGPKARLLRDAPGPGRVPFADARAFFAGEPVWLEWRPEEMHRPKSADLFEPPKLVVQRIRGRGPARVAVDRSGIYLGHTCTIAVATGAAPPLERLAEIVGSPLTSGILRVERGASLDFYPHAVAAVPVPEIWWHDPDVPLPIAWGLTPDEAARLSELGSRG